PKVLPAMRRPPMPTRGTAWSNTLPPGWYALSEKPQLLTGRQARIEDQFPRWRADAMERINAEQAWRAVLETARPERAAKPPTLTGEPTRQARQILDSLLPLARAP